MSYMTKCVMTEKVFQQKLKPSKNLIIFILNENVFIPITKDDFKKIVESRQNHEGFICIEDPSFNISNEKMWFDSTLETIFRSRYNTIKLEEKARFKTNEQTNVYYSVIPVPRKTIDNETKEGSLFSENEQDENKDDSKDEHINWNVWNDCNDLNNMKTLIKGIIKNDGKTNSYEEEINLGNNKKHIKIYKNFILEKETWLENNKIHRHNNSAVIEYYDSGKKKTEHWMINGVNYRESDLPTFTKYYENGNKEYEVWGNKKGILHRNNDLPARISYYENGNKKLEQWFKYGRLHRIELPAYISYHKNGNKSIEKWFVNNEKCDGKSATHYNEDGTVNYTYNHNGFYDRFGRSVYEKRESCIIM